MSLFNLPLTPYKLDDYFITGDQSFASVLNAIVENELEGSENGEINLQATVTLVEPMNDAGAVTTWDLATWSRVTVQYEDFSEVYSAYNVVSSMSVGVLEERGKDVFGDSIQHKLDAMNFVYEMVVYKNIYIQFPDKFWADDNASFLFVETAERGRCHTWQSLDTVQGEYYPGSNILLCAVPDYIFEEIKEEVGVGSGRFKIPQAEVMKLLRDSLGQVYPDEFWNTMDCEEGNEFTFSFSQHPPTDTCMYYTFPEPNPNWLGSYVNWKVNADGDEAYNNFLEYIRPLPSYDDPHLILSGSAVCDENSAYVHGGYLAGKFRNNCVFPAILFCHSLQTSYVAAAFSRHSSGKLCDRLALR